MAENRQNKQKRAISSGLTLVIGPKVGLNIPCNDDDRNTDTKYYHRDSKLG